MTSEEYIKSQISTFLKKHSLDLPVILERPKEIQFGDYASNIAMQLARPLKKAPRDIAEELLQEITLDPNILWVHVEVSIFRSETGPRVSSPYEEELVPAMIGEYQIILSILVHIANYHVLSQFSTFCISGHIAGNDRKIVPP